MPHGIGSVGRFLEGRTQNARRGPVCVASKTADEKTAILPAVKPSPTRLGRAALLASAFALGGCQPGAAHAPRSHPDSAAAIVAQADWSRAEHVRVEMLNHSYRPNEWRLKAHRPYRITLANPSANNHYFTAPEFFRSVATRKAMVPGRAEVKAPYFTGFEVLARTGEIEIYLVPLEKGRYRAYCDMKEHREFNIEGVIVVE
jgi:hypothetical protein